MQTKEVEQMQRTVLVVDDDSDFLYQQRLQLEASGFKVIEAATAEQAKALMNKGRPDIAIVDLMIEYVDAGFSLCYFLKKKWPDLPVIMVTGVASETGIDFDASTEEERAWVKADVLLSKPIRFEQLKREIDRLLQD